MKPVWNVGFFSYVTLYDDLQRKTIDTFLHMFFQVNQPHYPFEYPGWPYKISFANNHAFAI